VSAVSGRFIDYDAARAEARHEPVVVRAFGRDWNLFDALPARVVFDIVQAQADGQEEFTTEQALGIIRSLVPQPVLDAWFDAGLAFDEAFNDLVQAIMHAYISRGDEESEAGKAPGPEGPGSMPSSTTGS
jgi:hypothetical protein